MPERPLPTPRRLATPDRGELLRAHSRRERLALVVLSLEVAIVCGCAALVIGGGGPRAPVEAALLGAVAAAGMLDWLPAVWGANRKRLEHVRPEARFGAHSRASLVASVERVAARLGIRDPCPVYLVRDKEINAAAMPLSLLPGVGSFAAIHLNRAVLHLLDEAELESVIGHEFGHVYRYADLTGRCLLVHAAFAAALTTVLGEFLAGSELRYGAPLMALIPARWLAFSSTASRSREVEFLCDDCGAIAAGTRPAMRAQVKLALEAEVRGELMDRVLEALLEGHDVPVDKLLAAYDAALPFGAVAPDEARIAIQGGIDRLRRGHGELSLAGFWQFMFARADVDEDAVRDQLARGQAVRDVELVSVRPRDVLLGHASLERCVAAIETESHRVLVHVADEIDDRMLSHPNCSRRLLFLWRSRGERTAAEGDAGTSAARIPGPRYARDGDGMTRDSGERR